MCRTSDGTMYTVKIYQFTDSIHIYMSIYPEQYNCQKGIEKTSERLRVLYNLQVFVAKYRVVTDIIIAR